jgi:predicted nucleic acid-binding protein
MALGLVFLPGCKATKNKYVIPEQVTKEVTTQISSVEIITKEANKATDLAPQVKPHTDIIIQKASDIAAAARVIKDNHSAIMTDTASQLTALANQRDNLVKENVKLKSDNTKLLSKWLSVTIFAAGLSTAVAIALFFLGKLRDVTLAVVTGSVLLGAITLQFLLQYAVFIAIGVTLLVAVPLVYRAFITKRSLKEVIETTEETKKMLPEDKKEAFKTTADELQSTSTIQMVKEVRLKNGLDETKKPE